MMLNKKKAPVKLVPAAAGILMV